MNEIFFALNGILGGSSNFERTVCDFRKLEILIFALLMNIWSPIFDQPRCSKCEQKIFSMQNNVFSDMVIHR